MFPACDCSSSSQGGSKSQTRGCSWAPLLPWTGPLAMGSSLLWGFTVPATAQPWPWTKLGVTHGLLLACVASSARNENLSSLVRNANNVL